MKFRLIESNNSTSLNEAQIIIHHGQYIDPDTFLNADGKPYDLIDLDIEELAKFMSNSDSDADPDTTKPINRKDDNDNDDNDEYIDLDDYDPLDDEPDDEDFSIDPSKFNGDDEQIPKDDTIIKLPDKSDKISGEPGETGDIGKSSESGKPGESGKPEKSGEPGKPGEPGEHNNTAKNAGKIMINKKDNREYVWDDSLKKYVRFV